MKAYNTAVYSIDTKQVKYINEIIEFNYNGKLNNYNLRKEEWDNCNRNNNNYILNYCSIVAPPSEEPKLPKYYEFNSKNPYPMPVLKQEHYEYFQCNLENFKLLKKSCGKLTNISYNKFNPYACFWGLIILMIPVSILISILIVRIFSYIIKIIKKTIFHIKIEKIKNKLKNFVTPNKSNLSAKLEELNSLKEKGLITEEDYNKTKSKLLDEF